MQTSVQLQKHIQPHCSDLIAMGTACLCNWLRHCCSKFSVTVSPKLPLLLLIPLIVQGSKACQSCCLTAQSSTP